MKLRCAVAGVWLVSVLLVMVFVRADVGAYSRALALARALGLLSLTYLGVTLCVSPLARLLRVGPASNLRRALGLAAAASALLHATCAVWQSPLRLAEQYEEPGLRWGMGALLVLCALAVTSFGVVLRRLRLSTWKELHRLAYAAFGCGVLHALSMPFAWTVAILGGSVLVLLVGLLRFLPGDERERD